MSSKKTSICRKKLWLFRVLDALILISPILIYVNIALFDGGVSTVGKISVVGTVVVAIILTAFNVIAQKRLRCPIWIMLIGLYVAIRDYLLPLIFILAFVTILDDLILTPIIEYYRTALIANKQIDEREEV